jgi:CpeT protein
MTRSPLLPTVLAAALSGCSIPELPSHEGPGFDAVGTLERNLVGVFDSERQSIDDPRFFAIQLVTCPVHAPELGEDVVYVEQAVLDDVAAPYRQRLYRLDGDGYAKTATTTVYALVDPAAAVGLCDREMETFVADEVTLRSGCGVLLDWDAEEEAFVGGTADASCESTMNGASFATAQVWIGADRITSWDRGFDAHGEQVWGAVAGPYEFLRRE